MNATMAVTDRLLAELRAEAATTRRVLERVPEDQLCWKPHEKSMSLGQLALHMAWLPQGIAMLVSELSIEFPEIPLDQPRSRSEILDALDRSVATAAEKLSEWGADGLAADWTATAGGAVVANLPRGEVVRTLMLNHWYHHRGQLTVYLRLLGIPLPPVYGPTADESLGG